MKKSIRKFFKRDSSNPGHYQKESDVTETFENQQLNCNVHVHSMTDGTEKIKTEDLHSRQTEIAKPSKFSSSRAVNDRASSSEKDSRQSTYSSSIFKYAQRNEIDKQKPLSTAAFKPKPSSSRSLSAPRRNYASNKSEIERDNQCFARNKLPPKAVSSSIESSQHKHPPLQAKPSRSRFVLTKSGNIIFPTGSKRPYKIQRDSSLSSNNVRSISGYSNSSDTQSRTSSTQASSSGKEKKYGVGLISPNTTRRSFAKDILSQIYAKRGEQMNISHKPSECMTNAIKLQRTKQPNNNIATKPVKTYSPAMDSTFATKIPYSGSISNSNVNEKVSNIQPKNSDQSQNMQIAKKGRSQKSDYLTDKPKEDHQKPDVDEQNLKITKNSDASENPSKLVKYSKKRASNRDNEESGIVLEQEKQLPLDHKRPSSQIVPNTDFNSQVRRKLIESSYPVISHTHSKLKLSTLTDVETIREKTNISVLKFIEMSDTSSINNGSSCLSTVERATSNALDTDFESFDGVPLTPLEQFAVSYFSEAGSSSNVYNYLISNNQTCDLVFWNGALRKEKAQKSRSVLTQKLNEEEESVPVKSPTREAKKVVAKADSDSYLSAVSSLSESTYSFIEANDQTESTKESCFSQLLNQSNLSFSFLDMLWNNEALLIYNNIFNEELGVTACQVTVALLADLNLMVKIGKDLGKEMFESQIKYLIIEEGFSSIINHDHLIWQIVLIMYDELDAVISETIINSIVFIVKLCSLMLYTCRDKLDDLILDQIVQTILEVWPSQKKVRSTSELLEHYKRSQNYVREHSSPETEINNEILNAEKTKYKGAVILNQPIPDVSVVKFGEDVFDCLVHMYLQYIYNELVTPMTKESVLPQESSTAGIVNEDVHCEKITSMLQAISVFLFDGHIHDNVRKLIGEIKSVDNEAKPSVNNDDANQSPLEENKESDKFKEVEHDSQKVSTDLFHVVQKNILIFITNEIIALQMNQDRRKLTDGDISDIIKSKELRITLKPDNKPKISPSKSESYYSNFVKSASQYSPESSTSTISKKTPLNDLIRQNKRKDIFLKSEATFDRKWKDAVKKDMACEPKKEHLKKLSDEKHSSTSLDSTLKRELSCKTESFLLNENASFTDDKFEGTDSIKDLSDIILDQDELSHQIFTSESSDVKVQVHQVIKDKTYYDGKKKEKSDDNVSLNMMLNESFKKLTCLSKTTSDSTNIFDESDLKTDTTSKKDEMFSKRTEERSNTKQRWKEITAKVLEATGRNKKIHVIGKESTNTQKYFSEYQEYLKGSIGYEYRIDSLKSFENKASLEKHIIQDDNQQSKETSTLPETFDKITETDGTSQRKTISSLLFSSHEKLSYRSTIDDIFKSHQANLLQYTKLISSSEKVLYFIIKSILKEIAFDSILTLKQQHERKKISNLPSRETYFGQIASFKIFSNIHYRVTTETFNCISNHMLNYVLNPILEKCLGTIIKEVFVTTANSEQSSKVIINRNQKKSWQFEIDRILKLFPHIAILIWEDIIYSIIVNTLKEVVNQHVQGYVRKKYSKPDHQDIKDQSSNQISPNVLNDVLYDLITNSATSTITTHSLPHDDFKQADTTDYKRIEYPIMSSITQEETRKFHIRMEACSNLPEFDSNSDLDISEEFADIILHEFVVGFVNVVVHSYFKPKYSVSNVHFVRDSCEISGSSGMQKTDKVRKKLSKPETLYEVLETELSNLNSDDETSLTIKATYKCICSAEDELIEIAFYKFIEDYDTVIEVRDCLLRYFTLRFAKEIVTTVLVSYLLCSQFQNPVRHGSDNFSWSISEGSIKHHRWSIEKKYRVKSALAFDPDEKSHLHPDTYRPELRSDTRIKQFLELKPNTALYTSISSVVKTQFNIIFFEIMCQIFDEEFLRCLELVSISRRTTSVVFTFAMIDSAIHFLTNSLYKDFRSESTFSMEKFDFLFNSAIDHQINNIEQDLADSCAWIPQAVKRTSIRNINLGESSRKAHNKRVPVFTRLATKMGQAEQIVRQSSGRVSDMVEFCIYNLKEKLIVDIVIVAIVTTMQDLTDNKEWLSLSKYEKKTEKMIDSCMRSLETFILAKFTGFAIKKFLPQKRQISLQTMPLELRAHFDVACDVAYDVAYDAASTHTSLT